jgi:hypothetical protein
MEALLGMQCPRQYPRQLPRASPRTFFAGLTAKRQRKAAVASSNPCVAEIDNYLHGRYQQKRRKGGRPGRLPGAQAGGGGAQGRGGGGARQGCRQGMMEGWWWVACGKT